MVWIDCKDFKNFENVGCSLVSHKKSVSGSLLLQKLHI